MNTLRRGFTLIEMMVIAPIVILLIGSFIALIVNLTGEVLSSRGSNSLTYDIQDALNRIEGDVKLSTTYLAVNNTSLTGTKQGYGSDTTNGSTVSFTNIKKTGGSNASLILNGLVTNGNPMSSTTGLVYLANKPNDCSNLAEYSKNTPMTMNVVYFVDASSVLWRRVIMRSDYNTASLRCGATAAWQQPSCIVGYNAASMSFCKANDVRLLDGIAPSDFSIQYFPSADSTAPDSIANNTSIPSDVTRGIALQSTPTVDISITSHKTIAGREISSSGSIRVTRLDTNASSIAIETVPIATPAVPTVSATVSDGHNVTFKWPHVDGAMSYDLEYRINGGAWQNNASTTDMDNNERSYVVTSGNHTDTVEAHVRATNSFGDSSYGSTSLAIPLWAPLILNGGWTDYVNGYGTAAYTKTKSGLVLLKGLIRNPVTPAINDVIGSLPLDYKPTGRLLFGTSTTSNTSARLDISPNTQGTDVIMSSGGDGGWFSLDTVRYVANTTTNAKVVPALQNGFTVYGSGFEGPSYSQDTATGRVSIQGLLTAGTLTNGTVIFTIPAALRPTYYEHHASISSVFSHVSVDATSGLLAKGDGASYYSINTSYLPSSVTAWSNLTLVNGWVPYLAGSYPSPQYIKTSDGLVQLRGLIKAGTASYDTIITTLPAGFRPKGRILSTSVNSGVYSRLDILANGEVHFMGTTNTWYSFDNVVFPAEQ
ncbi:MAG: hypothetical protein ACOH18_01060 [Candidatus Saccharimonadaceae bacterium]